MSFCSGGDCVRRDFIHRDCVLGAFLQGDCVLGAFLQGDCVLGAFIQWDCVRRDFIQGDCVWGILSRENYVRRDLSGILAGADFIWKSFVQGDFILEEFV